MNKKQKFERLLRSDEKQYPVLFRPILMHFAARHNGYTYAEFASDYRTLVDCNIRALNDFDMNMAFDTVGKEVIRCGNINPNTVQNASEEELWKIASDLVESEKGRKFILSVGCEITLFTPPRHLKILSDSRVLSNEN